MAAAVLIAFGIATIVMGFNRHEGRAEFKPSRALDRHRHTQEVLDEYTQDS